MPESGVCKGKSKNKLVANLEIDMKGDSTRLYMLWEERKREGVVGQASNVQPRQ